MSTRERITVLLVDDHAVVREGYRRLLEREPAIHVVGEAADAATACELARALRPDVIVMDIALPGASGIDALRTMLAGEPSLRVLIFSMYEDAIFRTRAFESGARGYLTKASAPVELVQAVYAVARGEQYPPRAAAESGGSSGAVHVMRDAPLAEPLTPRELEVLKLLVRGETVRAIGEQLGLSEKTVANHQSTLREKLGARNGVQLARAAARLGLADLV